MYIDNYKNSERLTNTKCRIANFYNKGKTKGWNLNSNKLIDNNKWQILLLANKLFDWK